MILLLVYFYIQVINQHMFIKLNANIHTAKIGSFIPDFFIGLFVVVLSIFIIVSYYKKDMWIQIAYFFLASFILSTAFMITMNMLQLNNETLFLTMTIYHPIPLSMKSEYLQLQILALVELNNFDKTFLVFLGERMPQYFIPELLKDLNCESLNQYAYQIISENYYKVHNQMSYRVHVLGAFLSALYFSSTIFSQNTLHVFYTLKYIIFSKILHLC